MFAVEEYLLPGAYSIWQRLMKQIVDSYGRPKLMILLEVIKGGIWEVRNGYTGYHYSTESH